MSCLRRTGTILAKSLCCEGANLPAPLVQFARGIKPRWLPKSKSKIFYVRKPTPIDPEEHSELRIMYFHYRTELRAVRSFLVEQQRKKMAIKKKQHAKEDLDHMAEFQTMEEQVRQWNSSVQTVREEMYDREQKFRDRLAKDRQRRQDFRMRKQTEKAQQKLDLNLEESENFITLENLDTEIEKLLNVRQDYNFAIDKQGNKVDSEKPHTVTAESETDSQQQESVKS